MIDGRAPIPFNVITKVQAEHLKLRNIGFFLNMGGQGEIHCSKLSIENFGINDWFELLSRMHKLKDLMIYRILESTSIDLSRT